MKRLYLLRHAQALSTPVGGKDFDRALSPQGTEDTKALGALMEEKSYAPDVSLYSPALRTFETFQNLHLKNTASEAIEEIYDANAEGLLDVIYGCDDGVDSLLIVGHNPTIHELTIRLSSEESSQTLFRRLMSEGYKPGSLSVLDCPCVHWNDIQLGENTLIDLQEPLDYNAPNRPTRWM